MNETQKTQKEKAVSRLHKNARRARHLVETYYKTGSAPFSSISRGKDLGFTAACAAFRAAYHVLLGIGEPAIIRWGNRGGYATAVIVRKEEKEKKEGTTPCM